MNSLSLVGYVAIRPKLAKSKKGLIFTKFSLLVKNNKYDLIDIEFFEVNCFAFGEMANYVYRNCTRGTLVEITGSIGSMRASEESKNVINYVIVKNLVSLTKREIAIEQFDDFIERYEGALLKTKIDKKKSKDLIEAISKDKKENEDN